MKPRDTVHREAGDDGHIRHADLSVVDDCHLADFLIHVDSGIVVFFVNLDEEAAVDFLDNLIDSRKEPAEKIDRPFFQCFRHDRVVCISAAVRHDVPRLVPGQRILIEKDAHELRHCQRRMCIIHLENIFFRKLEQVLIAAEELLDRLLNRRRNKEILLAEPQLLALVMIIAGIKDFCDQLCEIFICDGLGIIALVKRVEAELFHRLRIPDAQRIDEAIAVADDRKIIRNRFDALIPFLPVHRPAGRQLIAGHIAAEMNFLCVFRALDLQRVAVLEPVVRLLNLVAVDDLLPEHAVVITDAAPVRRIIQRRQRIKEAGSESSETSVAKRRIRLLILDCIDVKAKLAQRLCHLFVCAKVDCIISECTPHQKFHGKINQFLRIFLFECLLRADPAVDDLIAERHCRSLEHLLLCRIRHLTAIHRADVVCDAALEQVLVKMERGSFRRCHEYLPPE